MKKRFHAACAIRGLKMSQVVVEMIEQWLKVDDASASAIEPGESVTTSKVTRSQWGDSINV